MTVIAEAAPEHLGTVRPPAHLAEMPAPSRWRQFHAEVLAMHVHAAELVRRFGADAVGQAMTIANARQSWLDVEGFKRVTERTPGAVKIALIDVGLAEPDVTVVGVAPVAEKGPDSESAYEKAISGYRRGILREAVGSVFPPLDSREELDKHAPTPPGIEGDQRTVVAGALMIEAAAGDGYTNASAAEVLFSAYGDVLGATAAAVGVQVEQPAPPAVQ